MNDRYQKLGIKQTIQCHWMDYVVHMLLDGMSEKDIRSELNLFLATQKQSGGVGDRGQKTYGLAVGTLSSWFSPEKELLSFRNRALSLIKNEKQENWLPYHWAIISASYPFWFNVAKQTGRLLNLQSKITQAQVFSRLKEQYGDRNTVSRNARYVIRSFVSWGALADSETKGCYKPNDKIEISNPDLGVLLFEAALYADKENKSELGVVANNPAFFPFSIPILPSEVISHFSDVIEVIRMGSNEELLKIRKPV